MNTVGVFLVRTSGVTQPEVVDIVVEPQARPPLGLSDGFMRRRENSGEAERDRD